MRASSEAERLQLSLRRDDGVTVSPGKYGVEVESSTLHFSRRPGAPFRVDPPLYQRNGR